jgi:hypothetical protein
MLWLKYAVLFLTTFTATTSWVFIFWHLTTCPKVPCPSTSKIRYRFLMLVLALYHKCKANARKSILRLLRTQDIVDI